MASRYRCTIGDDWVIVYAFGGVTVAATIRAMEAHVEQADQQMMAVHCHFLSPVSAGEIVIDTETLRTGRSVTQIAGELRNAASSDTQVRVAGTWASPRIDDPVAGRGIEPPDVPDPSDPSLRRLQHAAPFDRFPMHARFVEWRCPGYDQVDAMAKVGAVPEAAVWLRLADTSRSGVGRFERSALALIADRAPGPHLGPALAGPGSPGWGRPLVSLEMSLKVFDDPVGDWFLSHSRVDHAGGGIVATHVDIWDEQRHFIATSEQLARYGSSPVGA